MNETFEEEYLGKFTPDPLVDLADKYLSQCEEFDEKICSGRRKGVAIPLNSLEYATINRHAKELKKQFILEVESRGFTKDDFQKSIRLLTNKSSRHEPF